MATINKQSPFFQRPWMHCPVKKVKLSRYTPWRRLEGEEVYSSRSLSTSALDGGEWSASRPGRLLPPGKGPPVSIGQETGWAPEPVWTQRLEEKSSASVGDRTPVGTHVINAPFLSLWQVASTRHFFLLGRWRQPDISSITLNLERKMGNEEGNEQ
jgi:hypothetical protein